MLSEDHFVEVAVAVILGADGRYLLSQRHPEAHQGGRWEFPGGKLEKGETPEAALRRELAEELGLLPINYAPLITIPYVYPEKSVRLHVYRVLSYQGMPRGREGQGVGWYSLSDLSEMPLPDANRGILTALRLPDHYLITPEPGVDEEGFLEALNLSLERGIRFVQFRAKGLSDTRFRRLARATAQACYQHDAYLMINGPVALARDVGARGIHLTTKALAEMRPDDRPENLWIGVSCHNLSELERAVGVGADFGVCSPVRQTSSHPDVEPMGWNGFAALCEQAPFPIYALGGMGLADIQRAQGCGGHGIAGIRSLWG